MMGASVSLQSRLPTVMLNTGGRRPLRKCRRMGGLWRVEEDPAKRIMTFDAAVVPGNMVTIGFDSTRAQTCLVPKEKVG